MGILVGLWDCKYCDTTGIAGTERNCPNCSHPRDEDTVFYLGNNPHKLTKNEEDNINKNSDWVCSYCGALNSDNEIYCKGCGGSKTNITYFDKHPERKNTLSKEEATNSTKKENTFSSSYNYSLSNSSSIYEDRTTHYSSSKVNNIKNWLSNLPWGKIAIIFASLILIAGLIWLIWPKPKIGTITGMSWKYTINYEEYRNVTEEDWYIPEGGTEVSHRQAIRSYVSVLDHYETKTRTWTEQVLDHYEDYVSGYRDLGNGYFEEIYSSRPVYRTEVKSETYQEPVYRQEPVWDTKYTYTIWKWVDAPEYKQITRGDTKETRWAITRTQDGLRISSRNEEYYITIAYKDKITEYSIDKTDWLTLNEDETIRYKIILGKIKLIKDDN